MPGGGLEPPRCCHRPALNRLRLPFRHPGRGLVAGEGFEPSASWLWARRAATAPPRWVGRGRRSRTFNLRLIRPPLDQLSYPAVVGAVGFEPTPSGLKGRHSTIELHPNISTTFAPRLTTPGHPRPHRPKRWGSALGARFEPACRFRFSAGFRPHRRFPLLPNANASPWSVAQLLGTRQAIPPPPLPARDAPRNA